MTTRIYLARPIDGRDENSIYEVVHRAKRDLHRPRFEIVDPITERKIEYRNNHESVVAAELELLQSCDVILVDMSIINHVYIGCIGELIYAHLWNLSTVIYVGSNGTLIQRPWLRFHANHIDIAWKGAIEWIYAKHP